MKTVASWLDRESLAELGLLAERKGVVVDGCATKHSVIQALLGSGKVLQPVADGLPSALHSGTECGTQGPTSMSGTVAGQPAASSSAAAGHASADNGAQETPAQETPVVSQVKPDTKATEPARAIEAKGGGDKWATRRSPDPSAATASAEGIETKKGQGVSGVERQPTPRPGDGSSRAAGKWKGTPAWRTSPEQGKSATTPRNTAVLSGTGAFFVTPEQTSPCELRCKCSRVRSNGRSSPPSARSPELAETAMTPTRTAASTAARAPASAREPTTLTGLRDSSNARAARNGVDNPASRKPPEPAKAATTPTGTAAPTGARFSSTAKQLSTTTGHRSSNDDRMTAIGGSNPSSTTSPHPAKTMTTPRGTASLTVTRVPSSVRQPTTPIPTNHRTPDRAVKVGQGNPASTTSPHPAKTVKTPRNTAVSTGNRVFFGSGQPTTPTSFLAARASKNAKVSPASTPSPHLTKTVTTPRGTATSASTRVPSSAKQPTTPTARRGNNNGRAVTTGRGNPASTTSPHPAKAATTPKNRAVSTGNRVFFGTGQPATPTTLHAGRTAKDATISPASTPSPHPTKTEVTTPRGTAASTSTRVPSSARQPTTPTSRRGNHKDRVVTIGRGNPASTTSPHPAKVETTPRDRAVSTGNRVFFGPRQPTTPTSLRAARAAKNAKIISASTPSLQPAEAAVTTPRGMATSVSTRVPSSARQPTTPTAHRGNSNDRAATDRESQASRRSSEPTGAAETPRSTPGATCDRISLVARQAAEGIRRRSVSARASTNRGGKLASGRLPEQADATRPSRTSYLLADASSSVVASNSAQGLGSTSSGGAIECRHPTAQLSVGAPEDSGSGVEPSPIVPATGEDSLLEAPSVSEPSEMEPAEPAEAAQAGGQTDRHVKRPRSEFAPRPTCSMAEYMMPQIQLLNALQRTVLFNPF
ncbi:unnamed protein product [Ectocarpus sp. 12 AP-2014]